MPDATSQMKAPPEVMRHMAQVAQNQKAKEQPKQESELMNKLRELQTSASKIAGIVILALFCSPVFADLKAVIDGPNDAIVGDLVVLDASKSIADGLRWVSPDGINTLTVKECPQAPAPTATDSSPTATKLVFASGTPGVYTFQLIVADKSANIDYVFHTVTVRTKTGEPPPDNPPPDGNPLPEHDSIVAAAKDAKNKMADDVTAKNLVAALTPTIQLISDESYDLTKAKAVVVSTIDGVMQARAPPSDKKDWMTGWRVPMNGILKNYTKASDYVKAWNAILEGLKG